MWVCIHGFTVINFPQTYLNTHTKSPDYYITERYITEHTIYMSGTILSTHMHITIYFYETIIYYIVLYILTYLTNELIATMSCVYENIRVSNR